MNQTTPATPVKTAADYAAIAVAPLLIFLMISSLANFLTLTLYHGSYPARVAWILMMFTLGAVGIARVAIERDRTYSLGYAGILGLVTFVAMLRFVDSPAFVILILGLVAYLSDVIVRDCTLIDESVDSSGQGLIDSGRLFVKKQMRAEGTVDADGAPKPGPGKRIEPKQPGRTVMYLALAALPLFGLGQFFLRDDAATWERAQRLLAFYLFASLSLLVTTSFLGLRRYLRQRKVDMPSDVSVAWLVGGMSMIATVLLIAYMAPLPGRALANFELPFEVNSPGGTTASRFGWGQEGADNATSDAPRTEDPSRSGSVENPSSAPTDAPGNGSTGDQQQGPAGTQPGGNRPGRSGPQDAASSSAARSSGAAPSQPTPSQPTSQGQASSAGPNRSAGEPSRPSPSGQPAGSESTSRNGRSGSEPSTGRPSQESSADNQPPNATNGSPSRSARESGTSAERSETAAGRPQSKSQSQSQSQRQPGNTDTTSPRDTSESSPRQDASSGQSQQSSTETQRTSNESQPSADASPPASQNTRRSSDQNQRDPANPGSQNQTQPDRAEGDPREASTEQREPDRQQSSDRQPKDPQSEATQSEDNPRNDGQRNENQATDAAETPAAESEPAVESEAPQNSPGLAESLSKHVGLISTLVRMAVYLALFGIVAAFLWLNRDQIRHWWEAWFGPPKTGSTGEADVFLQEVERVPPRRFASFRNPLQQGLDDRKVVVITFQAFEAWAREQGASRSKDETPNEFLRRAAKLSPQVAGPVSQIVDAYNRVVYGKGRPTRQDMQAAAQVWQVMQSA